MQTLKIDSEKTLLPSEIIKKFMGKEIQIIEFRDGYFLKPVSSSIKKARGSLKNGRFSTEKYFEMKNEEKKLEK